MELRLYRTLWGVELPIAQAAAEAAAAGFSGLEGQVPTDPGAREALAEALAGHGLDFIAEITTAGSYVPDRRATVAEHLVTLEQGLRRGAGLHPRLTTCIAGCDAWSEVDSRRFFAEALDLGERFGMPLSFETHRSRSLFNPWVTQRIATALPQLQLTVDFSHWCVVCERLMDSELEIIETIAPQVRHVHARVGYDQGPQVPDPAAPEYGEALAAHQRWWEIVWRAQRERGFAATTMTPEFGPDGYLHELPYTREPVSDLWTVNQWMARTEREHFERFVTGTSP
jgi:sugar phosphate isomerase/epimerase